MKKLDDSTVVERQEKHYSWFIKTYRQGLRRNGRKWYENPDWWKFWKPESGVSGGYILGILIIGATLVLAITIYEGL